MSKRNLSIALALVLAVAAGVTLGPGRVYTTVEAQPPATFSYYPVNTLRLQIGEGGTPLSTMLTASGTVLSAGTSVAIDMPGVLSTDKVLATINSGNSSSRSILTAVPTANTVTVTLSGTPGADSLVSVMAFRNP
jgi:hypothetical protein